MRQGHIQCLEKFCMEGLRLKGLHNNEEYTERLRMELGVIAARGFSKYFLTMNQISDKAKQKMLVGPGRGSAAGSLVAYALSVVHRVTWIDLWIDAMRQDTKAKSLGFSIGILMHARRCNWIRKRNG